MISVKPSRECTACYSIISAPHLQKIFGSIVRLWKCRSKNKAIFNSCSKKKKKKGIISLFHCWGFLSQNRFLFSGSSYCANEIAVTKAFLVTGKLCCEQMLKGNYYLKDKVGRNFPICKMHSPSQIQRLYITQ